VSFQCWRFWCVIDTTYAFKVNFMLYFYWFVDLAPLLPHQRFYFEDNHLLNSIFLKVYSSQAVLLLIISRLLSYFIFLIMCHARGRRQLCVSKSLCLAKVNKVVSICGVGILYWLRKEFLKQMWFLSACSYDPANQGSSLSEILSNLQFHTKCLFCSYGKAVSWHPDNAQALTWQVL